MKMAITLPTILALSSLACTCPAADSLSTSSASREDDETHTPVISDSYGTVPPAMRYILQGI